MNKRRLTAPARIMALMVAVALSLYLALPMALAGQEDIKELAPEILKPHSRPAAVFMHDAHNDKAKIDDCATCHHGKDADGKQDKTDMSAGTPCSDCHSLKGDKGETPLVRAYHQQCISCHTAQKAGPTYCSGCHQNK